MSYDIRSSDNKLPDIKEFMRQLISELILFADELVTELLVFREQVSHLNSVGKFGLEESWPREFKSNFDFLLHSFLVTKLEETKLPILSEEGPQWDVRTRGLKWIIDPLDGTLNFHKKLGPYCISIGLWEDLNPIYGLVIDLDSGSVYRGGLDIPASVDQELVAVSRVDSLDQSVFLTGFPTRFNFAQETTDWFRRLSSCAKVRMVGCASFSIVCIARGDAEIYEEQNIMIWDVAGAIPIVVGAGGCYDISSGDYANAFNVTVSNGLVTENWLA